MTPILNTRLGGRLPPPLSLYCPRSEIEAYVLLSMTGFGEARHQDDHLAIAVEVRTVNNRHLKLSARVSDPYSALEPELEALVRKHIRRGSVQLSIRVERPKRPEDYRLNTAALTGYRDQLQALRGPDAPPVDPATLLVLPGVVEDRRGVSDTDPHEDWPLISRVVGEALSGLQQSRAREGQVMADELLALGREVGSNLERVVARAPEVVAGFQQRLLERVQALVQDRVEVEAKDLIREVGIFSERADVAEEITRLRAHLDQFAAVIDEPESAGRKLEFIVQEMGRETNTIGSKANDVEISRAVVEMKGALEKIRELIQNVE